MIHSFGLTLPMADWNHELQLQKRDPKWKVKAHFHFPVTPVSFSSPIHIPKSCSLAHPQCLDDQEEGAKGGAAASPREGDPLDVWVGTKLSSPTPTWRCPVHSQTQGWWGTFYAIRQKLPYSIWPEHQAEASLASGTEWRAKCFLAAQRASLNTYPCSQAT